eukprot:1489921-Lingulodinium_polyedra.AAC.1
MKKLQWMSDEAASVGNEWPACCTHSGPMAAAYWNTKEHIDVLRLAGPPEDEIRSHGYECRCATSDDIPAIIPDGQGPHYLYYVRTDRRDTWPWCR